MKTATFDAAHLADSVNKAARIAPSRGAGFDKAAGIVFWVSGTGCQIQATDLECSYWQNIPIAETTGFEGGETVKWRLASTTISKLVSSFPLDTGLKIKLIDNDDSWIRISAGRTKVRIPSIDTDTYPNLAPVSRDGMSDANNFAAKVAQVAWATAKDGLFSGVHIDGQRLVATDRYTLAIVPCEVALSSPVTVPLGSLVALIKDATDAKIKSENNRLELALDAETVAAATLLDDPYPNVMSLTAFEKHWVGSTTFSKQIFVETVERMLTIVASEKMPRLVCTVSDDEMILDVDEPDLGKIQETIDCQTLWPEGVTCADLTEQRRSFTVTPSYLKNAVNVCKTGRVNLSFGHRDDPQRSGTVPIIVSDDTGYKAYVMPRQSKGS